MRRREFTAGLGAAAWSLTARAQQPKVPVIGFLDFRGPRLKSPFVEAFRAGLSDGGFIDGANLSIEYRSAGGNLSRLPDLAADLVRLQVAVMVTAGVLGAPRSAKAATSTIPIVFLYGGDPVTNGLIASLNRPGGNVTGITTVSSELVGKRLDLLLKVVPQANKFGFLSGTRNFLRYEAQTTAMLAAGRALGVEIMIVECRDDRDYEAAVAKMAEGGARGMILGTFALPNLDKIVPLAALHKLPTIYSNRAFTRTGGLMSYDADLLSVWRRIGSAYVAGILKGAKPADIPVEQPTKFEFVINLKTAIGRGTRIASHPRHKSTWFRMLRCAVDVRMGSRPALPTTLADVRCVPQIADDLSRRSTRQPWASFCPEHLQQNRCFTFEAV